MLGRHTSINTQYKFFFVLTTAEFCLLQNSATIPCSQELQVKKSLHGICKCKNNNSQLTCIMLTYIMSNTAWLTVNRAMEVGPGANFIKLVLKCTDFLSTEYFCLVNTGYQPKYYVMYTGFGWSLAKCCQTITIVKQYFLLKSFTKLGPGCHMSVQDGLKSFPQLQLQDSVQCEMTLVLT